MTATDLRNLLSQYITLFPSLLPCHQQPKMFYLNALVDVLLPVGQFNLLPVGFVYL